MHETPFSLNLHLKKSFAKHWSKPDFSAQNNLSNQTPCPQHVSDDPVRQSHHPSVVQPKHPDKQTVNNLSSFNHVSQKHHHNHQLTVPPVPHVDHHDYFAHQHKVDYPQQDHQNLWETLEGSKLPNPTETLKAEHDRVIEENLKDYAELDKAFRKLSKENKELQTKHMKVSSEVKVTKTEKESILKENKALSVALKSSKKDLELNLKHSSKEFEALREELTTLNEYKIQQQQDKKKARKLEKKLRQKEKKKPLKAKEVTADESEVADIEIIIDSEKLSAEMKSNAIEEEPTIQTETNSKSMDSENNQELVENPPVIWESEEIRFKDFPENFDDWSEEQEKDAYSNNFKLYLQKYLKRTIKP